MTRVLLATFDLMPDGEAEGRLIVEALARRGVEAAWAVWDDPDVDWAAADLVAVRSTWDYHRRLAPFLAWVDQVASSTALLNGAGLMRWNVDKAYLAELPAMGVPAVPTLSVGDDALRDGLGEAVARWGTSIVKPRVGAGGVGVVVIEDPRDASLQELSAGPWVLQPLVASVRTVGESSVYVIDGRVVGQAHKHVGTAEAEAGEVRVHPRYGGRTRVVDVDPERARIALGALDAVQRRFGASVDYARVDLVQHDGAWVVSELELIEPSLYLDTMPTNAEHFADLVVARLP